MALQISRMYIHRSIVHLLDDALASMPVVVVSGPRQSGKSTLLRQEESLRSRRYLTLDDAVTLAQALREPDSLLDADGPITIDEAQRAPKLLLAIKRAVDRNPVPGRFLLSGSANFLLLRKVAESLAGRAVYLHLGPISWHERKRELQEAPLWRMLSEPIEDVESLFSQQLDNPTPKDWIWGGFPGICLGRPDKAWRLWFTGYRQTYLERDLRDLTQIVDLGLFEQFVQIMSLRSAQVLNIRDVARDCGSNAPTISRWLGVMETGFIGQRLPPYFSNRVKRLVKAPKWYLTDSGLMAFLAGMDIAMDVGSHPLKGSLFETFVLQNLVALVSARVPDARILHYRSHEGHEVDFVIETSRMVLGIEAKAGTSVDARDIKGLRALVEAEKRCKWGLVAYMGREVQALGPRLFAVPVGRLLS